MAWKEYRSLRLGCSGGCGPGLGWRGLSRTFRRPGVGRAVTEKHSARKLLYVPDAGRNENGFKFRRVRNRYLDHGVHGVSPQASKREAASRDVVALGDLLAQIGVTHERREVHPRAKGAAPVPGPLHGGWRHQGWNWAGPRGFLAGLWNGVLFFGQRQNRFRRNGFRGIGSADKRTGKSELGRCRIGRIHERRVREPGQRQYELLGRSEAVAGSFAPDGGGSAPRAEPQDALQERVDVGFDFTLMNNLAVMAEAALERGVGVAVPLRRSGKLELPEVEVRVQEFNAVGIAAGFLSHLPDQAHSRLCAGAGQTKGQDFVGGHLVP